MLNQKILSATIAVERQSYAILSEIEELTQDLSQAFSRRDQVSVRLFLNMRQEQIIRLQECKTTLDQHCAKLPAEDGTFLRRILAGEELDCPGGEALLTQIKRNKTILSRILRADKALSIKMGGKNSFYAK